MVEECGRCHQQLEVLAEPCGPKAVVSAMGNLVLVYGKGVEAQAQGFWKVYCDALADLPRAALDRACGEYAKIGKFFPKPAEIRELAEPHAGAMRSAAFRSRRALAPPPKALPPAKRMPREQFDRLMAEFADTMKAKAPPQVSRTRSIPPPCAAVDDRGVSAEMRALLDRQNPQAQDRAA